MIDSENKKLDRVDLCLADERRVAAELKPGEVRIWTWVVGPSVICGRNQDIPAEVDLDYCKANGIEVYRRHSGGGAVYADSGNIMLSYVTRSEETVPEIFARWIRLLADALRQLGIDAQPTGRNDIEVDGRKVSGGAFYRTHDGASIAHSTLLYDTNAAHMANALTPPAEKLARHGVVSVPARIGLLRDYTDLTFDQLRVSLERILATNPPSHDN